jgi:prevent-host-death family protein
MQVNILEAKNRLSQLVKSAQAGEEVIIANRGEPVARLVPLDNGPAGPLPRGNGKRIVEWIRKHPLPAYARRSAEEIDAAIEEERAAWE